MERIIALENVRIKLPEGRTATCAKATYMVRTEVLKMEGNPVLREDGNQLSADIIYFYFTENRSQAEGNVKVDFTSKENSSPAGGRSGGASGPTGQSGQTGQAAGAGN